MSEAIDPLDVTLFIRALVCSLPKIILSSFTYLINYLQIFHSKKLIKPFQNLKFPLHITFNYLL